MDKVISIRGCRLHNLKNVDAQFPLGKITVVCGPSGCGKSTLVLDTLHGESKRRYLETLSPFAAELLGGRRIIPIDSADGLPASLAVGPSHGEAPAKAYALSLSECDSTLRGLFVRFAKPACPVCGKPMESQSREEIIKEIAGLPQGSKLQFFARIESIGPSASSGTLPSLDKLSAVFLAQGFTRAMADGVSYSLADLTENEKGIVPEEFFIVVDRVIVRENTRTRIAEAVDGVLKLTHGELVLDINGSRKLYSTAPRCPDHGAQQSRPLQPEDLSPYSRTSACPTCGGTGIIEKDDTTEDCPDCKGLRLRPNLLQSVIDNSTWKDLLETPFAKFGPKLHQLFDSRLNPNQKPAFNALLDRIEAINELGIGYLTGGRSATTLSGGEIQRLRLSSLSTGHLNNLLIVLDEPASGLHQCDVEALWKVLKKVQSRGNTLVLIEHNPGIIKRADWIIEMGPGAGEKGGEILFQGTAKELLENPQSPTGAWIRILDERRETRDGRKDDRRETRDERGGFVIAKGVAEPATSKAKWKQSKNAATIGIKNFAMFDMKPVSAEFPVQMFSVITGASGSGKSTLLFKNLAPRASQGEFEDLGIQALSVLSTGDFHGNRRSTVASAISLNTMLRDLFAKLPESKVRGYTASKFATHAPGGRCENCKGEGVLYDPAGYEETECPVCLGKRFKDEILEVRFKSLSIADILDLEIGEAYKLFINLKPFADKLKSLVDTGLDYLKLGQTTAHLSGGERARLRLSIALARAKAPNTLFLFDEPARGLHQKDIQHLLDLIRGLTEAGHTVIAIEHAQDFVNAADYVVELSR